MKRVFDGLGKKQQYKFNKTLTHHNKCYIIFKNGGAIMFSDQVKRVRMLLNFSQDKLAQSLGVSFATINRWENSKNVPSKLAQKSFYDFCENNFIDVEELKQL